MLISTVPCHHRATYLYRSDQVCAPNLLTHLRPLICLFTYSVCQQCQATLWHNSHNPASSKQGTRTPAGLQKHTRPASIVSFVDVVTIAQLVDHKEPVDRKGTVDRSHKWRNLQHMYALNHQSLDKQCCMQIAKLNHFMHTPCSLTDHRASHAHTR